MSRMLSVVGALLEDSATDRAGLTSREKFPFYCVPLQETKYYRTAQAPRTRRHG